MADQKPRGQAFLDHDVDHLWQSAVGVVLDCREPPAGHPWTKHPESKTPLCREKRPSKQGFLFIVFFSCGCTVAGCSQSLVMLLPHFACRFDDSEGHL